MEPKVIGNYMIRSKTNEGFAAKVYWQVYNNGTIIILKRILSKLPNTDGKKLIRVYKDFFVYEIMFSIKADTLSEIMGSLHELGEVTFTYSK